MSSKVYSKEQLLGTKANISEKRYSEAAFLWEEWYRKYFSLGELRDFEIFNHTGTGLCTHAFHIWAKEEGGEPIARVLESHTSTVFYGHGFQHIELQVFRA